MKTHTTTDSHITPLHALAKRLEAWRASRSVGQRIPEELWQEAVSLAQILKGSPIRAFVNRQKKLCSQFFSFIGRTYGCPGVRFADSLRAIDFRA